MSYTWQIPDGYWKTASNGKYESHEAICILNVNSFGADVKMTLYFENAEKMGGFSFHIPAERTLHVRMDKIKNDAGQSVPADRPYAALLESDAPLSMQYTRVDSSQKELTIATTLV